MTDDTWQFGTLRPQTYRLFTFDPPWKMRMGTGKRPQHYPRMTDEEALLFKFRRPPPRLDKGIRELIVSPLREHSRKPEEFYANCEKFCDGPRGELFGRFQRPGWDVWGNEPEKFNAAALAAGADLGIASAK